MADLTRYLPVGWELLVSPSQTKPPEDQLIEAICNAGMKPPHNIVLDGRIHRFPTDERRDKTGWYVAYPDDIPAGAFGDWRTGMTATWCAEVGRDISPEERAAIRAAQSRAREERLAADAQRHDTIASVVQGIWETAADAPADHPYLTKKGVKPHGAKVTGDGRLIVPVYHPDGALRSLQYIAPDGNKAFHPGGEVRGCLHMLGEQQAGKPLYIAEGFATAASIFEATNCAAVIAYNAGNLAPASAAIRGATGDSQVIVFVADNDESSTGERLARAAASKIGGEVIVIPEPGDANDYVQAGHDLAALLEPAEIPDWLIHASDFVRQPAPIKWLIKGWLQANATMMLFGPSGAGKTFVALDMACRIASNSIDEWQGGKVRHGTVIYLAGEGHQGLRARMAGWMAHNQVARLDMWISQDGCDLNTYDGLARTKRNIHATGSAAGDVKLIVIDTLHRFLQGDENSAQDSKTMLDSCASLMTEFGCSVLLIHHTGVNQEAQGRARGSSAWKGAQDIEIQVTQKPGGAICVKQTKSKDSEPAEDVWVSLREVEVPGWLDEDDGTQVTTVVLEAGSKPERTKPMPEGQRRGLSSFRAAAEEHGTVEDGGLFTGVHLAFWREAYYKELAPEDAMDKKRQAFNRAKKDLLDAGEIIQLGEDFFIRGGEFGDLENTNIAKKIHAKNRTEAKK